MLDCAKVATRIAIGYTLDEIVNAVTGKTYACFEPALDYVVITTEKLPVDRPYLVVILNRSAASDRAAGTNAARLVKRMPLIDLRQLAPAE